eukprot:ctg_1825.g527
MGEYGCVWDGVLMDVEMEVNDCWWLVVGWSEMNGGVGVGGCRSAGGVKLEGG